jgi:hypothetical protein
MKYLVIPCILLWVCAPRLVSQWNTDPSVNTPIVRDTAYKFIYYAYSGSQHNNSLLSLSGNRVLIPWSVHRFITGVPRSETICAQLVNADGNLTWPSEGVAIIDTELVHTTSQHCWLTTTIDDRIVLFYDRQHDKRMSKDTTHDLRLQIFDILGRPTWPQPGKLVSHDKKHLMMQTISLGNSKIVCAWKEWGSNTSRLKAQCLDTNGVRLWGTEGIAITPWSSPNSSELLDLAPDGNNGTYILYKDSYSPAGPGVYLHRLDSNGTDKFAPQGVSINGGDGMILYTSEILVNPDRSVTVAFTDWSRQDSGIYIQRFDSSGAARWTPGGVRLGGRTKMDAILIVPDEKNGAIIAWTKKGQCDSIFLCGQIRAQRISNDGRKLWDSAGVILTDSVSSNGSRWNPSILPAQAGGAILVWEKGKSTPPYDSDIRAQRLDSNGVKQWGWDGVLVCVADLDQLEPYSASDGHGGAIIAWNDLRNGTKQLGYIPSPDIYATRIGPDGSLYPVELLGFRASLVNGNALLHWSTASETNNLGFDVERLAAGKAEQDGYWERIGHVAGARSTSSEQHYRYLDQLTPSLLQHEALYYRLKQIDYDGTTSYSPTAKISLGASRSVALDAVYPNPATDRNIMRFSLPAAMSASLRIYDRLGREVAVLTDGWSRAGTHSVEMRTAELSAGVYLAVLRTEYAIVARSFLIHRY